MPYDFLGIASSTFVGGYALTTIAVTHFLHNLAVLFTSFHCSIGNLSEKTHSNIILGAFISLVGVGLFLGVSIFHALYFTNPRFLIARSLGYSSAVGYAGIGLDTNLSKI